MDVPKECSLRRLPPQMVNSLFFSLDQVAPRVTVTSSGRTVKRISQQLDDDPDQEVPRESLAISSRLCMLEKVPSPDKDTITMS